MLLYCASLCWTNYSCDKCDISPSPSEPRYWREQSDSRLPSDVTLDWLETPPCRAAAATCTALLWNYLLLRNGGGLIHERQPCQGLWTRESLYAFVLISSLIADDLFVCSAVTSLLKSKLIIFFFLVFFFLCFQALQLNIIIKDDATSTVYVSYSLFGICFFFL